MMIQDSREKDLPRKQEGGSDDGKTLKFPTSSRSWSGLKDSRIVRVSRSFGGKDRHSKVRTIRGLRDRRVRLSVPTAIQLYDLQDRLGLNQPSKVVDWLLNATQQEIDKLPPLEMPSFAQYPHSIPVSHEIAPPASTSSPMEYIKGEGSGSLTLQSLQSLQSSKESRFEDNATEGGQATQLKPKYWNSDVLQRTQFREFPRDLAICEKGSSVNGNEQENVMPYAAYFHHLESTNVSISHLGGYSSQVAEDPQNYHPTIIPSSSQSSLPILFCPSNFPSYMAASVNYDRQSINNFQLAPSASQILLPDSLPSSFHPVGPTMKLSISPKQHNSQNQ